MAVVAVLVGCTPDPAPPDDADDTDAVEAPIPGSWEVGVDERLSVRGDRQIPVTIWYPAEEAASSPPVAPGSWPVVVFSHGLRATPATYSGLARQWVDAGFVVVAPTYPFTNTNAATIDATDVVNQPADASTALDDALEAAATPGDRFEGHLDAGRVVAAGHSEGGITTVGLFDGCCRDERLRAGVVLAGNSLGFSQGPSGPAAPMLFVHGDADRLVPLASGQRAADLFAWPKAFVTLLGEGHVDPYIDPTAPAFAVVSDITVAFLRYAVGDARVEEVRAAWEVEGVGVEDGL